MDKEYGGEFSVEMIEARRVLKTNIKKIREVEGLSQEAFGKKYGKSMSSISNYETGMSLPSFEFLLTLREQYDFSMEEFITSTDIEITKGGNQGAKAEGTGKNLNKYVGAYFIYLFDTSSHGDEHEKSDIEAVHFGVLSIYKKRGRKDTLGVMGCFNMADSKTKVFHDECSRIFEINDAECEQRLKEAYRNRRNTSVYYGDLAFSRDNLFINLNSGEKDKAFIILRIPNSESPKYIGGIGTINSVSKGRYSSPCIQNIGLSRFYLKVNPAAIGEKLIFEEINPELIRESRELTEFFKLLYCNDRPITAFEEETKRRLIQSLMENYIKRYIEANLFRTNKVEVERNDDWYKFIRIIADKQVWGRKSMSRAELLFERMKQRMKYVYPVYNGYLCETADRWNVRRTAEGLMFQRTKGHYCRMALKMSEIRLPAYMLLAALLHDQQQDVLIQDIPKTIPEQHKIKLMQVLQYYHDLEDTIATSVVMEKLLNDMEDVHYLALILLFAKNLDLLRVRSRKVLSGELEITRKYLVLWARRLHIRYFEKEFREVEFRVTCKDYFQKTDILLQKLYSVNSESTKSLMEDIDGNIFELKFINKLRKSEFYNQLCNKGYTVSAEDYNNPVIYEIPLYNVYLLNSESEPLYMRRKSEEWVKYYLDCLVKKGYLLLGYEDETEQYLSHFILQGKWGVRYRIFICTTEICKRYFYSSKIQEFSEEKWHGKRKSGIIVYDKEKRPHEFDEKLTALDFAFYIHKDIGLCAKQAIINNEMRPLDTILKHGDTVTIISQSDVDNQKYSAEPGWMRFIKTQKAKEYIIRYLEIRFSELEG